MTTRKPSPANETAPSPRPQTKAPAYVKGSHTARVKAEQDERRVELLALHDVLNAQRDALNDQLADIGDALALLSRPDDLQKPNIVPLQAAQ